MPQKNCSIDHSIMILTGKNIGKKFGKNWIFRSQNFTLETETSVAITGKNGSGKSTLLQIMAGFLTPSEGEVEIDGIKIDEGEHSAVFVGPYTEIIEEFTLKEFLEFHSTFKKNTCSIEEMAESASLPLSKPINDFSTGMKQRAKLITSFFFENDIIYMDEPTSNLDVEGFEWWKNQLLKLKKQLIIIASNDLQEIELCQKRLNL